MSGQTEERSKPAKPLSLQETGFSRRKPILSALEISEKPSPMAGPTENKACRADAKQRLKTSLKKMSRKLTLHKVCYIVDNKDY